MRVLVVDDDPSIRKTTGMALRSLGHEIHEAADRSEALERLDEARFHVVLLDLKLGKDEGLKLMPDILQRDPRLSIIVFTAFASVETAVEAMRSGAVDYIAKPFTPAQIREVLARVLKTRRLQSRVAELESRLHSAAPEVDLETSEPSARKAYDILFRVAPTSATLLLHGESGTGKTILARATHERSGRREAPFVTINCPSLSAALLESELFGHVRGSFTGAMADTWGKVAQGDGGTLFLDEIGELPLEIQPKLLRLLQDREYERVGEAKTRTSDVRVIAATNRDLEVAVRTGRFREDLYYRINVISVRLAPLRERPNDLRRLATRYLEFFSRQCGRAVEGFSPAAEEAMSRYPWPGNMRELRNAVERAAILSNGHLVHLVDLPEQVAAAGAIVPEPELGAPITIKALEQEHIRRVLERSVSLDQAARTLGIDPATLYRRRKRLGEQR